MQHPGETQMRWAVHQRICAPVRKAGEKRGEVGEREEPVTHLPPAPSKNWLRGKLGGGGALEESSQHALAGACMGGQCFA
jgi:hypothetical protein